VDTQEEGLKKKKKRGRGPKGGGEALATSLTTFWEGVEIVGRGTLRGWRSIQKANEGRWDVIAPQWLLLFGLGFILGYVFGVL
jgi:hypothetical protein